MDKLTLKLSIEQLNAVLFSLAKMPYDQVVELIGEIRKQAQEQLEKKE